LLNLRLLVLVTADASLPAVLCEIGLKIGTEQIFPARLVQKLSSGPTLLSAHPSFGYQDNLSQLVHGVTSEDSHLHLKAGHTLTP
jgi:hypothetical protein